MMCLQVAVSVDSKSQEQTRLASVHFALLVDGLRRAGIWGQVCELHCSCERWLGPVRLPSSLGGERSRQIQLLPHGISTCLCCSIICLQYH